LWLKEKLFLTYLGLSTSEQKLLFGEEGMAVYEYELLKCEDCGKTLGYIYVSLKTFPPKGLHRFFFGFPYQKMKKSAFCEECFSKLKAQVS